MLPYREVVAYSQTVHVGEPRRSNSSSSSLDRRKKGSSTKRGRGTCCAPTAPLQRQDGSPHLQQGVAGPPFTPGHISPFCACGGTAASQAAPASAVSRGTRSRCRSLAGRWEGRTVGSQHTSLHGHLLGGHAGQDSQVACGSTSSATKGGSGDARLGPVAAAKQVRVRIITLLGAMRELNERPRRSGSFVRVLGQLSSHRTVTRRLWSCGAATSATRAAARPRYTSMAFGSSSSLSVGITLSAPNDEQAM